MGKKRIATNRGASAEVIAGKRAARATKKKLTRGIIHIQSTYNNTKLALTDLAGNLVLWSSSGALGFRGTKKGTPFAAGKVAEWLLEQSQDTGLGSVDVVVRGVGAGRDAALRVLASRGLQIDSVKDTTPIPFNGPKPKKPRRV